MNYTSFDMIGQEHENVLSSNVWQPAYTAVSQGWISILWKPMVCTIGTRFLVIVPKGYLVHGLYSHGYAGSRTQKGVYV